MRGRVENYPLKTNTSLLVFINSLYFPERHTATVVFLIYPPQLFTFAESPGDLIKKLSDCEYNPEASASVARTCKFCRFRSSSTVVANRKRKQARGNGSTTTTTTAAAAATAYTISEQTLVLRKSSSWNRNVFVEANRGRSTQQTTFINKSRGNAVSIYGESVKNLLLSQYMKNISINLHNIISIFGNMCIWKAERHKSTKMIS